jgi:DNA-binding transcriptional LysR family regulator
MAITFRQLAAFRAVVETGTVTQAAEMLHVSQPAVSRMLGDLEHELGFKLFRRANRQIVPTAEGLAFHHEVQRAFVSLKEIAEAGRAIREYRTGQLRLISIPSVAASIVPRLLAGFTRAHPDINVVLEVQPAPRIFEWLVSMQFDLGISALPADNALLAATPILLGDAVCVLPPRHPLAKKDVIRPEHLADETFISFRSDSHFRFRVDAVFDQARVRRSLKLEARTNEAVLSMTAAGLGVAVVGPFFPPEAAGGAVIRRFEPAITMELALLQPTRRSLSRVAALFADSVETFVSAIKGAERGPARIRSARGRRGRPGG